MTDRRLLKETALLAPAVQEREIFRTAENGRVAPFVG